MSTATSEKQCTGCGATVTQQNGNFWRDSAGHIACGFNGDIHRIDLPPVAIKSDYGSALDENNVCPTCFRKYEDDGFKFCTADDCPSHPDYRVAIKPEVALTPLEKEMLAALKEVQGVFSFNGEGIFRGKVANQIRAAIAKAEAVQA